MNKPVWIKLDGHLCATVGSMGLHAWSNGAWQVLVIDGPTSRIFKRGRPSPGLGISGAMERAEEAAAKFKRT